MCWEVGLLPKHPSWMFTLTAIQHLTLIMNSSVNFIIYCAMGTKYVKHSILLHTLTCSKLSSRFRRIFLLHFKQLVTDHRSEGEGLNALTIVEDENNPSLFIRLRRYHQRFSVIVIWFYITQAFVPFSFSRATSFNRNHSSRV